MTEQMMLSAYSQKTITMDQSIDGFRRWNRKIVDWDIDYRGYSTENGGDFIDFHVAVELREAIVKVRVEKGAGKKKVDRAGYRLTVFQAFVIGENEPEGFICSQEDFALYQKAKAVDVFEREIMNIQNWVMIAELRSELIPAAKAVFECPFCGWVTDTWSPDISCMGCGKRFWAKEMWSRMPALPSDLP